MDLEIRDLRKKLVDDINCADLPVEVKRLVAAELLTELAAAAGQVIAAQEGERRRAGNEQGIQQDQLGELPE